MQICRRVSCGSNLIMVQNLIIDSRTDCDNGIFNICINMEHNFAYVWCKQGGGFYFISTKFMHLFLCSISQTKRDNFEKKFKNVRKGVLPLVLHKWCLTLKVEGVHERNEGLWQPGKNLKISFTSFLLEFIEICTL